ncbi:hypothetical protein FIBSPDRAFT_933485 [Athelia psychrophila]|uniref:Uncharacterized protein n=1 Tax=Athelia psychrophila TaxID=1759441 RepID=A0A166H0Q5_9AGAM|nr:hypothetical protein FIBSPDRAFT_933485 [Fibularhizoctonia sp. CBS 109695]
MCCPAMARAWSGFTGLGLAEYEAQSSGLLRPGLLAMKSGFFARLGGIVNISSGEANMPPMRACTTRRDGPHLNGEIWSQHHYLRGTSKTRILAAAGHRTPPQACAPANLWWRWYYKRKGETVQNIKSNCQLTVPCTGQGGQAPGSSHICLSVWALMGGASSDDDDGPSMVLIISHSRILLAILIEFGEFFRFRLPAFGPQIRKAKQCWGVRIPPARKKAEKVESARASTIFMLDQLRTVAAERP